MKKKFSLIKTFTVILLLSMFFTINVNASSDKKNYSNVKNFAQNFMKNFNSNYTLNDPIELYNFQDSVQALFFSSKESGYIIINLDDYSIVEFSPKNSNKFILDRNKKYYYNGPLSYFEADGTQIIDCKTKEKIGSLEYLKSVSYPVKSNKSVNKNINLNFISNSLTSNETHTLKNPLPNHSYNLDGRCTITAATMALAYYAKYWPNCNNYVSSSDLNDERAFSNRLLYFVTGKTRLGKDEYVDDTLLPNGLKNYLIKSQQITNPMNFYYISHFNIESQRSNVKSIIQQDKPIMLRISYHPQYGGHEVTAWGYCNVSNNEFFIVNDGWGNDFAYILPNYVVSIVY
ncbi:hypothetical protein B2H94_10045 [Clostridium sporogenes]|uniref:Peptidase C39-like domain-containing protein n=1 Tax=Clostridium sporogenes TaxID=1509 RepID=A0ABD6RVE2_CLOSG|nr:hypothetical protein [Clostridium sporogenes]OSB19409.1 hypothetical protein B2H94_10045 [Clostridium sporogenes]